MADATILLALDRGEIDKGQESWPDMIPEGS